MKVCSIEGCEKKMLARTWCSAHWTRWQRHGDPLKGNPTPAAPNKGPCSVGGCENGGQLVRGWCAAHYNRWRRNGDPLAGRHDLTPEQAFTARTDWDGEHLIWTAGRVPSGYGTMRVGERTVPAHRWAWEQSHGPIPDGAFVDHICHNRACVNVDHLRLATPQQNCWNRSGAMPGRKHDLPRGVYRAGRKYTARAYRDGQDHYFGIFSTPEEAATAAAIGRKELFGEYAGA